MTGNNDIPRFLRSSSLSRVVFFILFYQLTFAANGQYNPILQWNVFQESATSKSLTIPFDTVNAIAFVGEDQYWLAVKSVLVELKENGITQISGDKYGNPSSINALFLDNTQTLWLATSEGLFTRSRDGVFRKTEVPNMKTVLDVVVDKNQNIFVTGLINNTEESPLGIQMFNGKDWQQFSSENQSLPDNFAHSLTFDNHGTLWGISGMDNNSLVNYDYANWHAYNRTNTALLNKEIRAVDFDSQNNLWVATIDHIQKYNGLTWESFSLKALIQDSHFGETILLEKKPEILTLSIDESDVLWIGTNNQGVFQLKRKVVTNYNSLNSPLPSDAVQKIIVDNLNRKWILSGYTSYIQNFSKPQNIEKKAFAGIALYQEPLSETLQDWTIFEDLQNVKTDNTFYDIEKGDDGSMWLASSSRGLVHFKENHWYSYQGEKMSQIRSLYTSIAVNDNIIIGSSLNGLFTKDEDKLRPLSSLETAFERKAILDITYDNQGYLWIAHLSGVSRCKDGSCKDFDKKNGLLSNTIFSLFKDTQGHIWVNTTKGISVYKNGVWEFYFNRKSGLKGYVFDVTQDNNGNYWAATRNGVYKLHGDEWQQIVPEGKGVSSYLSAKHLLFDKKGTLWIGTEEDGVFTMSKDGLWQRQFQESDTGFELGKVHAMELAANGDVWISAQKKSVDNSSIRSSHAAKPDVSLNQENVFNATSVLLIHKNTMTEK